MKKLEYPKLKREQKRNCKLTEKEIEQIIELRKRGYTQVGVAKIFNVSHQTINRWDKDDEYRKEYYQKSAKSSLLRRKLDPKYKKFVEKQSLECHKIQYHRIPILKEYFRQVGLNNYYKRKEKMI